MDNASKKFDERKYSYLSNQESIYNLQYPLDDKFSSLDPEFMEMIQNPSSSSSSSSPIMFPRNTGMSSGSSKGDITLDEFVEPYRGNFETLQNLKPILPLLTRGDGDMLSSGWRKEFVPIPVEVMGSDSFDSLENGFESKMNIGYSSEKLKMVEKSSDLQVKKEGKCASKEEELAKTIERRQRRMIKNRESAARSRAKKQAYTNQLQQSVLRLQSINKWLKKKKEVQELLDSSWTYGPRYQLRRQNSI